MEIGAAFPSKYLKAADFEEQKLLTMADVKMEPIANDEHKPVLFFREVQKGMVLNKTNARTISKLYGGNTEAWAGKQIVAFSAMVDFRGDMVEAIRLRAPKKNVSQINATRHVVGGQTILTAANPSIENEDPAEGMDSDIPF